MKKSEIHKIQEQIDAYRRGVLTQDEIDALWVKLVEYPEQMEYLINTVNLEAVAAKRAKDSEWDATEKRTPVIQTFLRNWSRVAAVFLVVAGTVSAIYLFGSEYVTEPRPIAEIEMDNFRTSMIPTVVFDYEIQRAINLASMEEFEQALDKLEEIDREHLTEEQQVKLQINKGSIYFNRGDYDSAIEVFNGILANHDQLHVLTEEQVHWFLGNAYLQLDEEELAQKHIHETYDLNGAYRRLAERYLDQLQ